MIVRSMRKRLLDKILKKVKKKVEEGIDFERVPCDISLSEEEYDYLRQRLAEIEENYPYEFQLATLPDGENILLIDILVWSIAID